MAEVLARLRQYVSYGPKYQVTIVVLLALHLVYMSNSIPLAQNPLLLDNIDLADGDLVRLGKFLFTGVLEAI